MRVTHTNERGLDEVVVAEGLHGIVLHECRLVQNQLNNRAKRSIEDGSDCEVGLCRYAEVEDN